MTKSAFSLVTYKNVTVTELYENAATNRFSFLWLYVSKTLISGRFSGPFGIPEVHIQKTSREKATQTNETIENVSTATLILLYNDKGLSKDVIRAKVKQLAGKTVSTLFSSKQLLEGERLTDPSTKRRKSRIKTMISSLNVVIARKFSKRNQHLQKSCHELTLQNFNEMKKSFALT